MQRTSVVKKLVIIGGIILLGAVSARAQQGAFKLLQVEYGSLLSEDGAPEYSDFTLQSSVPLAFSRDNLLLAFPTFQRTEVNNLPFEVASNTFYRLNVPFIGQKRIGSDLFLGGILSPGIASDFNNITSDDLNLTAAVFLGNGFANDFQYRVGLLYSRNVNGNILFPAVSFNWQITDRLLLDVFNPLTPSLSYQLSPKLQARLEFEYRSYLSNVSDNNAGVYVSDTRTRLAPKLEYVVFNNIAFTGSFGYSFQRRFEVYEDVNIGSSWFEGFTGADPIESTSQSGWFFEVGLSFQIAPEAAQSRR